MSKFKEVKREDIQKTLDFLEGKSYYKESRYNRFWDEIKKTGREPYHYSGRFYYQGPAVYVNTDDEIQEIIRATSMPIQYDNLGLGYVIYSK